LARLIGIKLGELWGQSIVIDNRAGASGMIGTELAAKSAPDGYTWVLSNNADAISVSLYPKIPYDVLKDLQQVCLISQSPFMLVVHPSVPAHTLPELVALARAKPGELGFASGGGVGVPSHMAGEMLKWRAKIDLIHIPFKGQGPATQDVLAGHVPMMFTNTMNGLPFVRDGKLRALAMSSAERSAAAPDIPTVAELGYPGFDVSIWFGLQVPAGTPRAIVDRIAGSVRQVLEQPDVRANLALQGAEPMFEGPEAFAVRMRAEIGKWAEVVKAANIKLDN
jgi:tripartite-type tricarboxylate transporter receptor subunit TctC